MPDRARLNLATPPIIVWFRNDLRLADHAALAAAAETGAAILPVYILDDASPGQFRLGGASRWWLNFSLESLDAELRERGGKLVLRRGDAKAVLADVLGETGATAVHATRGYEPWEPALEQAVTKLCADRGAAFLTFPGRLLFEPGAIATGAAKPFRVFTPFWKACLANAPPGTPLPIPKLAAFASTNSETLETVALLPRKPDWASGFRDTWMPGEVAVRERLAGFIEHGLQGYAEHRNRLDIDGTSRLSPHLHFGEISPNQVWHAVQDAAARRGGAADRGAESFLRELGWREFSYHLLANFPDMPGTALRPEFARFPWRSDTAGLKAWQTGQTGYPIVDAAMRELWATGFMPNRARMIVASFLVKHLLISWQTGADWFLDTLVDADLANNSASWQWVAGSGTDAAPYFRIFNPVLQAAKFDPDGDYVRKWVPELARLAAPDIHAPWQAPALVLAEAGLSLGKNYPQPIVDHGAARERALRAFATIRR